MTAEKFVTLFCDEPGCQEFIEPGTLGVVSARKAARDEGWKANGSKDFCPEHANRRPKA